MTVDDALRKLAADALRARRRLDRTRLDLDAATVAPLGPAYRRVLGRALAKWLAALAELRRREFVEREFAAGVERAGLLKT